MLVVLILVSLLTLMMSLMSRVLPFAGGPRGNRSASEPPAARYARASAADRKQGVVVDKSKQREKLAFGPGAKDRRKDGAVAGGGGGGGGADDGGAKKVKKDGRGGGALVDQWQHAAASAVGEEADADERQNGGGYGAGYRRQNGDGIAMGGAGLQRADDHVSPQAQLARQDPANAGYLQVRRLTEP